MVWRISVTARDENLATSGPMHHHGAIVKVKRGLSFLRLAQPAADPRKPPKLPTDPKIVAVIGRRPAGDGQAPARDAGKRPRTRLVRDIRATLRKDDHRKVPLRPAHPPVSHIRAAVPVARRAH